MNLHAEFGSGLPGIWLEIKSFLAGVSFDRPQFLWLGFLPLIISIVNWLAQRAQQKRMAQLGRPAALASLLPSTPRTNRFGNFLRTLTILSLSLGMAGPRWGPGDPDGVAVGRDLVLVLDFSRSMLADDMDGGKARWQSAVAGCLDLLESLKTRGGHRVAVVVFAARPQLIVPLTTDYDHIRSKLSELNGRFPPATIRPDRDDFPSGTRIGAAIAFVVESLDQRFVEFRDVILLSDGDDPADDREWNVGVTAARKVNVPVHTVSLGDPDTGSLIPLGNAPLEFEAAGGVPDLVRTRAHEDVLKAIATEGRGQFLAARRRVPDLASFVRTVVDSNATRELTDDQIPQKKARFGWFYAFAVGMALLWWWRERT